MSRRAAHLAAPDVGKSCLKDTDCPDALECEVEHGKGTCQEHDEAGDDSNDDDTNGDSNGGPG